MSYYSQSMQCDCCICAAGIDVNLVQEIVEYLATIQSLLWERVQHPILSLGHTVTIFRPDRLRFKQVAQLSQRPRCRVVIANSGPSSTVILVQYWTNIEPIWNIAHMSAKM